MIFYAGIGCEYQGQLQQMQQGGDARYHADVAYRYYVTLEAMELEKFPSTLDLLKRYESKEIKTDSGIITFLCK